MNTACLFKFSVILKHREFGLNWTSDFLLSSISK
jgi:hypothetical protein